jgi:hypothetical protein
MINAENVMDSLRRSGTKASVVVASCVKIASELLVCSPREDALLVKKSKDSSVLHVNQFENILVVRERNELSHDSFLLLLLLFQLENISVELLLQSFVRVVDANLFKTVDLECFETKNIQHSNGCSLSSLFLGVVLKSGINPFNDKVESRTVNGLDESFASLSRLFDSEGFVNCLVSGNDGSRSEGR